MDFLQTFIQLDPLSNIVKILLFIFFISLTLIAFGFYFDFQKNKKNEKKLSPKKIVIDRIIFKSSIILI